MLRRMKLKNWSRGRELNPRPTDYESVALPLSYPGVSRTYECETLEFYFMCLSCAMHILDSHPPPGAASRAWRPRNGDGPGPSGSSGGSSTARRARATPEG